MALPNLLLPRKPWAAGLATRRLRAWFAESRQTSFPVIIDRLAHTRGEEYRGFFPATRRRAAATVPQRGDGRTLPAPAQSCSRRSSWTTLRSGGTSPTNPRHRAMSSARGTPLAPDMARWCTSDRMWGLVKVAVDLCRRTREVVDGTLRLMAKAECRSDGNLEEPHLCRRRGSMCQRNDDRRS